jgi:hypothetical protein
MDRLELEVGRQIAQFEQAALLRHVRAGTVRLEHYHAILTTVFHQTRDGPYAFALAAAHCSWRHVAAKEYLLQHAEEERTHWRWVLDDLASTGYRGPDCVTLPIHPTTERYLGFLRDISEHTPLGRLAAAAVLEGIGATFGGQYGRRLLTLLGLEPTQATFFTSHGETDKVHTEELWQILRACELDSSEWLELEAAARLTGTYYRAMYDHEAFA